MDLIIVSGFLFEHLMFLECHAKVETCAEAPVVLYILSTARTELENMTFQTSSRCL